jgi:hypothetical protein
MHPPWDHNENLKKYVFREGVHLEGEILYDLYIFGTECKRMHLEKKYIMHALRECALRES